jgi:hypothetical protein
MAEAEAAFAEVGRVLQTLSTHVSTIAATVAGQQQAYNQLAEATATLSSLSVKHTEMQEFALAQQANIAQAAAHATVTSTSNMQLNSVSKVFNNVRLPLF